MRYSEIDHILDGQILEEQIMDEQILDGTYEVVTALNEPKDISFVQTSAFYKVFYIFIIGSIFGCYMEQIRYFLQRDIWECRAGVIWGPFSEIYGVGAVLIYLLYRSIKEHTPLMIFILSAVCGSGFEYIASLFQELVFHSVTWNYSAEPFNLCGRTSLKYSIYWGLLGLFFIKCIYPILDRQMENIRGGLALTATWVFVAFMTVNLLFSGIAVDRWNERLQNIPSGNSIESYMDQYYDNAKMQERFPHMKFLEGSSKSA